MSAWLGFAWLLFLCMAAAWLFAAVAALGLSRLPDDPASEPGQRARRALLVALLPWLVPVTVTLSVVALAAAKPLGIVVDHCLFHGPGHPHLCLGHLPVLAVGRAELAGVTTALVALVFVACRYGLRERRMAARLRSMRALSHGFGRLRILDDPQPLALAANPGDPFVLLSRGMLSRITRRERRIVVAHEIAHLRHRDLARNVLFEALLLIQLPGTSRRLRRSWRQALEERADDRVARRFGSHAVARTLLNVLRGPRQAPALFSISGADARRRIGRMMAGNASLTPRPKLFENVYAAALLALASWVALAHHALETLLGFLAGG